MTAVFSEPAPEAAPDAARPAGGALLPRSRGAHRREHRIIGDPSPRLALVPEEHAGSGPADRAVEDSQTMFDAALDEALTPPPPPPAPVLAPAPPQRPHVRARAVLQDGIVQSWIRPVPATSAPRATRG